MLATRVRRGISWRDRPRTRSYFGEGQRSLRVRQVIGAFEAKERKGTYWGIRTNIADYGLADTLPCPLEKTLALAQTKTRLKRLVAVIQERLINWGYAVCDAAMRRWVEPAATKPGGFPYSSNIG